MEPTADEDRPPEEGTEVPPPAESSLEPAPPSADGGLAPLDAASTAPPDRPTLYWQPPAPEVGPGEVGWRGIGSVVGRTFDTYGSSFGLYLVLGAPVAIFGATTVLAGTNLLAILLIALFTAVVGIVTGAAMMLATDDLWRGVRPSIGDVLDRAAGRAVPLLLSSLAVLLLVGGVALAMGIAGVLLGVAAVVRSGPALGLAVVVLFASALMLLMIASVIAFRWAVSGPAIALDGLGPLAGLRRSWALTRRHLWRLTGLYLAIGLTSILASAGASLLTTYAPERALAAAGLAIATMLTSPLLAIAIAIVYRDLGGRPDAAREGIPGRAGRIAPLIAVLGVGLIVCAAGIWSVAGASGQVFIAERGHVITGTTRNSADLCHPSDLKTTFASAEEIWIAAIFARHVPAGESAVVEYYRGTEILGSAPFTAGAVGLDCYYEIDPIQNAMPGTYRIIVRQASAVLADGTFTIR